MKTSCPLNVKVISGWMTFYWRLPWSRFAIYVLTEAGPTHVRVRSKFNMRGAPRAELKVENLKWRPSRSKHKVEHKLNAAL